MKKTIMMILLIFISIVSIAPFYMLIMMTTQVSEDIFKGKFFVPGTHFMENVRTVLASSFLHSYWNSLLVSVTATVLSVFVSSLSGFALSKYEFRFKKAILTFVILIMMVPAQIGLIGFMIEMRYLHLNQTLIPLILVWITNAFGVFWMVQFIRTSVHNELLESARIDGCSEPGIFFRIVLPVIKPALSTLSLVIFLWSWNNYLLPLVLINKESLYTITLSIKSLGTDHRTDHAARLTGLLFAILPLILIFVIGSKSFIRGLTAGAIKG
jgi:multiple sugar transport system permease protein/cellobiose transport system permease protein